MINTLYGTLGAATGIAQGLFRGTFKPLPVPGPARGALGVDKRPATEITADCTDWESIPATSTVLLLPLLVVGHTRVGKTTLVNTYLHGRHLELPEPTLGADLSIKQLRLKDLYLSLQIWDTAGEDQAHLLDTFFWSNASGAVIVCNLHRADCLSTLTFWQSKMHQDACGLPIVIVAVKHGHGQIAESEVAKQQEQLAAQWCRDNDSSLFMVNTPEDQPSAAKAFTYVISKALKYSQQKAKPM
ncbi:hypothetical protein ABBQ32_000779 [Trebouxia sp. C0010 RCD-2024]